MDAFRKMAELIGFASQRRNGSETANHDDARFRMRLRGQNRVVWGGLAAAAVILSLIVLVVWPFYVVLFPFLAAAHGFIAIVLVGLGLLFATRVLQKFYSALRYALPPLTRIPAEDFSLYLRSFAADRALRRQERILSQCFRGLVAIGRPTDLVPPLGAARLYVRGNDWQQVAADLIGKANFIVVAGNQTEGLKWEFAQIRRFAKPANIAILFTDEVNYTQLGSVIAETWGVRLPDWPERHRFANSDKFHAIASFDEDWGPSIDRITPGRSFRLQWGGDEELYRALARIGSRAGIFVFPPDRRESWLFSSARWYLNWRFWLGLLVLGTLSMKILGPRIMEEVRQYREHQRMP